MRYRLRTLLIMLTIGPPLIAWAWFYVEGPDEFVGWLTFVGILSLAYWSLCNPRYAESLKQIGDRP